MSLDVTLVTELFVHSSAQLFRHQLAGTYLTMTQTVGLSDQSHREALLAAVEAGTRNHTHFREEETEIRISKRKPHLAPTHTYTGVWPPPLPPASWEGQLFQFQSGTAEAASPSVPPK